MKIPNTKCRLESQTNLLERHKKQHAAITPHILSISVLALLTGCNATLELKPDKAPGGTTGNSRQNPPYPSQIGPVYPVYPGPGYPGAVYPAYPGPFTSADGGYGMGAQPVSSSRSDRPTGGGITIKLSSR